MTDSGSILLSSVVVDRNRRIRKEVTSAAITAMAESISKWGLLHPIVLDEHDTLVAGETRLEAAKCLGWTSIPFRRFTDLAEREKLAIELEENVKRTDLPWQDQCDAIARFHALQTENEPEWGVEETAKELGYSHQHVYDLLKVAREASIDPEIREIKKFSVAKNLSTRKIERRASDELGGILPAKSESEAAPILTANFLEWVKEHDGPPFNLLHCDFPYGIGADKFNQGSAVSRGGYDDSEDVYWNLLDTVLKNKERLLGQSAHIVFWFSMKHYTRTLEWLSNHFWVDPYPLVWFKDDNTGTLPDPQRGPRRVYEVAFFCSHGDRKIIRPVANTFPAPVTRVAEHMSEKSQPMLEHFFRMVVDGNTRLLDPTCGSGSSLRAARSLGAASILGLELNPEFAEEARRAWNK